uniref:Uncharacterized protein AlNc14C349G10897 n=1 Tax=Albugo laibachii Nc14 TaxID=890382 RepID=F0WXE6_9STRA|nr:conserved hypothetical protein [Albugo laibachii Nc14]|eukprot:CCA26138.1 conserved hypothetical protein [Albugo laibachii Nc14]
MASIAASPVYLEGLKKRCFPSVSESYEASCKKRCRTIDFRSEPDDDAKSCLKYTQRQVDYFEQVKQEEISRLRTECEQFMLRKEADMQKLKPEVSKWREHALQIEKRSERYQQENKLLKRAITIQAQQKDECQRENQVLKQLTAQAAEHIKRLEQSNYALRIHLEKSTSVQISHPRFPDIF